RPLWRPAAPASSANEPAWPAEYARREDRRRLRQGATPAEDDREELRRVVARHLRRGLRGYLPDGLRPQVPHHDNGPADHRLARSADVPADPGGAYPGGEG